MPEVAAVGAIAVRDDMVLLVRRGRAPSIGKWSLPGGRVEPGESDADAVIREVAEETGLAVTVRAFAGEVLRPGPAGITYRIRDYLVEVVAGVEEAGDDATAVAWVPFALLASHNPTDGLVEALRQWGALP